MSGSQRITAEDVVTTLVDGDRLYKDNPSSGSGQIDWANFKVQLDARYIDNITGKLKASLIPAGFTGNLDYKGTVAGASVPASSTTAGDFYLISSAGTSQAITWAIGDTAVWNGSAWQKVSYSTVFASSTTLAASTNPRASRQGLVHNDIAGCSITNVPALGTKWTVALSCNIAANQNYNGLLGADTGGLWVYTLADGSLNFGKRGTAVSLPSFVDLGVWTHLVITNDGTTARVYKNGVEFGSSTAAAVIADYTAAQTGLGTSDNGSGDPLNGTVTLHGIANRALSAAEVKNLFLTGTFPAEDYARGTSDSGAVVAAGQQLINGANSTFASDTGWWSKVNGATITGGKAVFAANGDALARAGFFFRNNRYRITLTISNNTGTVQVNNGYNPAYASFTGNGTFTADFVATPNGDGNTYIYVLSTAAAEIDDITVTPLGLLCAPEASAPGNGYQWKDMSGNKADITLPVSGVSWALPDNRPNSVRGTLTWSGSHEAKALLGRSGRILPDGVRITSITVKSSAATSGSGLSIQSDAATNYWATPTAITTTKTAITPANVFPSSTADDRHAVAVDPDTSNFTGTVEVTMGYEITAGNP